MRTAGSFNVPMISLKWKAIYTLQYHGHPIASAKFVCLKAWQILQWNLSVTTTSIIKSFTHDLFNNVFKWRLEVPICSCWQYLPSGAHLGGHWPPWWAPEGREVSHYVVVIDRFHCIMIYMLLRSLPCRCNISNTSFHWGRETYMRHQTTVKPLV